MSGHVVGVTGGPAGIAATYAEARALADRFDAGGDRLREQAAAGLRTLSDPELLESGLLSPGTAAVAEAAVLAAAAGPQGSAAAALAWEADAVAVRVAISCLETADEGARATMHARDVALMGSPMGPMALGVALASRDPSLLQHVVGGLSGPQEINTRLLALTYGDRHRPAVASYPASTRAGRVPPTSVRDLIAQLQEVAALSPDPDSAGNGTIEVQSLRRADGSVRHVVYLPGTDRFDAPWDQHGDVRGMATNLDLMSGRSDDAYREGVREAMRQAGVRPDEPVLVVGHSQGGMAAAALVAGGSGFAVAGAVTAGSPTAQVPGFPSGTHVLSLEQRGDVVPALDGAPNRDSVEQTTVTFDAEPGPGVLDRHGYPAYLDGASLADASADPSVAETVTALKDEGFLGGDGVVASGQVFRITG